MIIHVEDVIADHNYEEILKLFRRIDDVIADSVFTDMVANEFKRRQRLQRIG